MAQRHPSAHYPGGVLLQAPRRERADRSLCNPHTPNQSSAAGEILTRTGVDFQKLQRAWALIRGRGPDGTHVFTGLDLSLPRSLSSPMTQSRWR
jgi:hypothetical protein